MPTTVRPVGDSPAAPSDADSLREEARRATEALDAESRRLEKLWDAYKAQEGELQAALATVDRLKAEVAAKGESALAVEATIVAKEGEIAALREDKADLEARIADLEALREDLKALDAYKARVAALESAYAAERERLAKLYLVYEELEAELEAARAGKA